MCSMCRIPVPVFLASFEQQLGDEQQAKALRLAVQHDMADAEARHASEGERGARRLPVLPILLHVQPR